MTDIDKLIRGKTLILIILSLFVIFIILFALLFNYSDKKNSNWPGYHLLLTDDKDNSELSVILENISEFSSIVSRYNTEIEYSNYNVLKQVKLIDIPERFNSADPRFDKFMKDAPLYFFTEAEGMKYEIFYIKSDLSEKNISEILKTAVPDTIDWEIASLSYKDFKFLILAVFIIITASLIYVKKLKTLFFLFISAVWIIVIFKSDINIFYVSILNIVFISYFIEIIELSVRCWFDKGEINSDLIFNKRNILICVSVFIFSNTVIFLVNPTLKSFLVFEIMFLIECTLMFLDLIYGLNKAKNYMHRIFYSRPILATNKYRIFDRWIKIKPVYFYIFVLFVSIPSLFFITGSSFKLPLPVSVINNDGNLFDNIDKLSHYESEKYQIYLPDISDYFTHLAYQIRLPYQIDYSLPKSNEKITVSHYISNKDNFQEEKKTAYLFTDSWLNDNIIRIKGAGLTGLIMSAGLTVKVAFTETKTAVNPVFFGFIYCFFYISLILMVVWTEKKGKTNYEKHILPVIKRRKQQAA